MFRLSFRNVLLVLGAAFLSLAIIAYQFPRQYEVHSLPANFLAGQFAMQLDDSTNASLYYQEALAAYPNDIELQQRSFLAYLIAGEIDKALILAPALVNRKTAEGVLAWNLLVAYALKQEDFGKAQLYMKEPPQAHVGISMVPSFNAAIAVGTDEKDYIKAIEAMLYDGRLAAVPGVQAAMLFEKKGQISRAKQTFTQSLKLGGMQYQTFALSLGMFFERLGNREEARKVYQGFLYNSSDAQISAKLADLESKTAPPRHIFTNGQIIARGFMVLAEDMLHQRQYYLAQAYTQIAHSLDPDLHLAKFLRGEMAQRWEKWEKAVYYFGQIDQTSPYHQSAQLLVSNAYQELGDFEKAIEVARFVQTGAPENFFLIAHLGDMYREREDFENALTYYQRAIALMETQGEEVWSLYFMRGICSERIDMWAEAEEDLQRALRLSKDDPAVLNYLGYSWIDQGVNLSQGLEMIKKAVEQEPDNGAYVDSLGWAYYRLNDFPQALVYLEKASLIEPVDPTITSHLGDVLWQLERKTEARYQWRKALAFEPDERLEAELTQKILTGIMDDL